MADFSDRLRELRKKNFLSQKALAAKIFVSQQTITKWENKLSTPNPEVISKLAEFFNCSADYLIGRTTNSSNLDIKKTPADENISERDKKIIQLLSELNPDEIQRVRDFVEGLKANRTNNPSQNQ